MKKLIDRQMLPYVKKLINRETILYLIFGVLTTLLNLAIFKLGCSRYGNDAALAVNVVAFVAAASFAYVTNKLFVFESKSWNLKLLCREIPSFFGARIASFAIEEAGLCICTEWLNAGQYSFFGINGLIIAKILLSVIVVILNYIFSKLFIFKQTKT